MRQGLLVASLQRQKLADVARGVGDSPVSRIQRAFEDRQHLGKGLARLAMASLVGQRHRPVLESLGREIGVLAVEPAPALHHLPLHGLGQIPPALPGVDGGEVLADGDAFGAGHGKRSQDPVGLDQERDGLVEPRGLDLQRTAGVEHRGAQHALGRVHGIALTTGLHQQRTAFVHLVAWCCSGPAWPAPRRRGGDPTPRGAPGGRPPATAGPPAGRRVGRGASHTGGNGAADRSGSSLRSRARAVRSTARSRSPRTAKMSARTWYIRAWAWGSSRSASAVSCPRRRKRSTSIRSGLGTQRRPGRLEQPHELVQHQIRPFELPLRAIAFDLDAPRLHQRGDQESAQHHEGRCGQGDRRPMATQELARVVGAAAPHGLHGAGSGGAPGCPPRARPRCRIARRSPCAGLSRRWHRGRRAGCGPVAPPWWIGARRSRRGPMRPSQPAAARAAVPRPPSRCDRSPPENALENAAAARPRATRTAAPPVRTRRWRWWAARPGSARVRRARA